MSEVDLALFVAKDLHEAEVADLTEALEAVQVQLSRRTAERDAAISAASWAEDQLDRLRAALDEIVHRTAFEPWSEGIKLHMTFEQMNATREALAHKRTSEPTERGNG